MLGSDQTIHWDQRSERVKFAVEAVFDRSQPHLRACDILQLSGEEQACNVHDAAQLIKPVPSAATLTSCHYQCDHLNPKPKM